MITGTRAGFDRVINYREPPLIKLNAMPEFLCDDVEQGFTVIAAIYLPRLNEMTLRSIDTPFSYN